ncbi:Oidioi.mRNA.OKI2018_I69.XSR.g15112.t1.cds [Oikopleura dioica]|uniref:Oidioi.mRNA.OKI2018_I69.XSR.g15112.t1.cds n=1 Tax=Oikopleura dioica TaxID=34765 RepID=A0ABN7SGV0_OIKDI|nr:Oidioi.mRNA.OKI2018_I69.XSR.g15112.t1.cds [Oikopleura dioica]
MLATDIAYFCVRQGLPFRVSHEIAGEVVALAENKNTVIDQLPAEEIAALNPIFGDGSGVVELLSDKRRSIEQYTSIGGTAPEATRKDIAEIRRLVDSYSQNEITRSQL